MLKDVPMPQMGESIAEGTLVKWHKKVGDRVKRDETLFEISTDKVDTEVPSPSDGFLVRILVNEGETVPVLSVVCVLGDSPPATGVAAGHGAAPVEKARPAAAGAAAMAAPPAAGAATAEARTREKSSPLVRRLAGEHGIDLGTMVGSGAGGRVTKEDILRKIAEEGARAPDRPAAAPAARDGDRVEPMSVMRQRIAEHMVASRRTSAHVTSVFEVDMTAVRALKEELGPVFEDRHRAKLTYLPFIIHAACRSLRRFPALNASIEEKNVRYHARIHTGIAVALETGLIVPVILDADRKSILDLARAAGDLAARARGKQLRPEEVQGGTFTITNPGVFGSLIGTPIINQPQVAILCVGAVEKRPVVLAETDAIAVRSMAYLSLTYDHRLVDGATADRFLADLKTGLQGGDFKEALSDVGAAKPAMAAGRGKG
jgi:2-oxoglutarate dehydrogenase E2 component (dihydrolipoamide succinyltransferase)